MRLSFGHALAHPASVHDSSAHQITIFLRSPAAFVGGAAPRGCRHLLLLPPDEAKAAYLGHLAHYSIVTMLMLASILGSALNPLDPEAYPGRQTTVAAVSHRLSTPGPSAYALACLRDAILRLTHSSGDRHPPSQFNMLAMIISCGNLFGKRPADENE